MPKKSSKYRLVIDVEREKKELELLNKPTPVNDEIRDKVYDIFCTKLENYLPNESDTDMDFIEKLACGLEEGLWEFYKENIKCYKNNTRKIMANITTTPNSTFVRKRLFNGEWNPKNLAKMTSKELYPELEEQQRLKDQEEERLNEHFKQKKLEGDSFYTCGKCKKNKVEHYQKQTKSADEPMTVFCHCLLCGNRWRC